MLFSRFGRGFLVLGCFGWVLIAIGCAASDAQRPSGPASRGDVVASRAALVDGQLVTRDDLWPLLAERGGAAALEAVALDRAIAREAQRRGVSITDADIATERGIVERALEGVGLSDRQQRGRVVAEARARRGWGPAWFDALLRRNALARKMVSGGLAEPTEARIARLYESLHGPRRTVRVLVMASERTLSQHRAAIAAQLARSEEAGLARFMALAVEESSDVSAARGGLLDPVTRVDPTYPDAFRAAVFEAEVGGLTPVVALDEGFALALVVAETPGDEVSLEEARPALLSRLRLESEQEAMAELFERLRSAMRIEPLDDALEWSWSSRVR